MSITVDRFFDIETEDWSTYVLGGVIDSTGTRLYDTQEELFDDLLDIGGHVWSWNGGLFDMLWWSERARRRGIKARYSLAGTRVTRIDCGSLVLRDAVALIPMSLQKASGMVGEPISKDTGLVCGGGHPDCGGYCRIRRTGMRPDEQLALARYLREDLRVGLDIMHRVVDVAESSGYTLTGTVGGSAWATARARLDIPPAEWDLSAHYYQARAGYYGGRVQVARPALASGYRYDINSAYPAALRDLELPCGDYMVCGEAKARRAYVREREGIYRATVHVPEDTFAPPLPWRSPTGRVCYPVGTFEGSWTRLELDHAEDCGATVEVDYGIVWGDAEVIFADLMEHCYARRRLAGKSSAEGKWHKWFANSLTGKLAEDPDKERVILNPPTEHIRVCEGAEGPGGRDCNGKCSHRWCCDHVCRGACKGWRCLDHEGQLWAAPFWRISDCGHVHWAAYLTAHARVKLHCQILADDDGGRSWVYCDTDSVYSSKPRTLDMGDALGQWGDDGQMTDFVAGGPKLYAYTDQDGKRVVRAKGLSGIDAADFEAFLRGETISRDRGVKGLKSAARSGEHFARKLIERTHHGDGIHFGDRVLASDGLTYPQTIQQIERCERWLRKNR